MSRRRARNPPGAADRAMRNRRALLVAFGSAGALLGAGLLAAGLYRASLSSGANEAVAAELESLELEGLGISPADLSRPLTRVVEQAWSEHPVPADPAQDDAGHVIWDERIRAEPFDERGEPLEVTVPEDRIAALTAHAARARALTSALLTCDGLDRIDPALPFLPEAPTGDGVDPGPTEVLWTSIDALSYALALAVDGRQAEPAWAAAEALLNLAGRHDWPTEAVWLSHRARAISACEWIVYLLSLFPIDGARRQRLDRALLALEDPRRVGRVLRSELARMLALSRGFTGDGTSADRQLLEDSQLDLKEVKLAAALRPSLFYDDRIVFTGLMARLIRAAGAGALPEMVKVGREVEAEVRAQPITSIVTGLQGRGAARLLSTHHPELVARLRMARLALALAAEFELPAALPKPLPDPFDAAGGSIRWRRDTPRSGLLWSVGSEPEFGQDEGQDLDPERWPEQIDTTPLRFRLRLPPRVD